MINNEKKLGHKIFVKKQIKDLIEGNIILHPIYRSDGLMLMKEYKVLSSDLAIKIKHQVPNELSVIILSPNYDMETFNKNQCYGNRLLVKELEILSKEYNNQMQISLDVKALVDGRIDTNYEIKSVDETNNIENYYIGFLNKSPLFSTFEEKLESSELQIRGSKIRNRLINTILENKVLLDKLNEIKGYKDILLLHSINTTSIALMIGLTLELGEVELLDLALANLIIDISVTQIPKNQFELHLKTKNANRIFYNLHLDQLKKLSEELPLIRKESIIYGIMDHYEYYNGKGYPKGKKESDISLFGRIILMAQAYDEMIGGYFYNNGVKPLEAIQHIWKNRGTKFDPGIVRIFIDRTTFFKVGQQIMLSNSKRGTILGFKDFINFPLSPIVKLQDGGIINLTKDKIT